MKRIDLRHALIFLAAYWLIVGVPQTLGRPSLHFDGISGAIAFGSHADGLPTRPLDANVDPYLLAVTP